MEIIIQRSLGFFLGGGVPNIFELGIKEGNSN